MYVDYNIDDFIIDSETSLLSTLRKINDVKGRIKFVLNSNNECLGSITNGDIIRWLLNHPSPDLNVFIKELANKNFRFVSENYQRNELEQLLKNFLFIPVLDSKRRVVAVAQRGFPKKGFKIGKNTVGEKAPCLVIAEIGNNHNGNINEAKKLVEESIEAGANCVKFQMRQMDELYCNSDSSVSHNLRKDNLATEYTKDLLSKVQLKNDELFEIFDFCKSLGVTPLCTPWDKISLKLLNDYGLDAFKFASADLTNHQLIIEGINTKKPLIISTGMSREKEIIAVVDILKSFGSSFCLLHCNSTYPAPFESLNLNYITRLKELTDCPVGYSGHERGINSTLAAVAIGAKIVERHITSDKNQEGSDHQASLLPKEFKSLVTGIREIEQSLGKSIGREIGQGEMLNRANLSKSIFTNCVIRKGEIITKENLSIKSPGMGLQPCYISDLVGRVAKREISAGDCFYNSDLEEEIVGPRDFQFSRPWGIPVRFHDVLDLTNETQPDIVEFHLSYRDLEIDFKSILEPKSVSNFLIHCPELFSEDHILDLSSRNDDYRKRSIAELNKVIDLTRKMKEYFGLKNDIRIIVNVGGFSKNQFLDSNTKSLLYGRLGNSLDQIDTSGVQLLPQTMPPFPWHFGGQSFHNLFVLHEEIVNFCEQRDMSICLDVSHSKLACTYSNTSFYRFCEAVAPYTSHIHIADSKGNNEEGLQINEGEIDFNFLSKTLNSLCPKASFIPEVWQGHENNGEGFWKALERLENSLNPTDLLKG
jgi:N-acetylneuraminate synthase